MRPLLYLSLLVPFALLAGEPQDRLAIDEPWSEMTVPRVVSGPIRLITPDVAIVDGASIIPGAVTMARNIPLLFVLKKEAGVWRIAAVRVQTTDH